jgi:ornithine decarboxylase
MPARKQIPRFATVEDVIDELKPGYPVYCLRPHELKRQAEYFLDSFPGRVMYAVKCNPHLVVLQALYDAGIRHFDTASLAEIALVREHLPQADCYFMHPVKARASLATAHQVYSVDHFVIDHENELDKLISITGGGDGKVVLVRIVTPVDADEGDWIEIGQTGAYSNSAATRFNGFYPETFVSVDAPPLLPG